MSNINYNKYMFNPSVVKQFSLKEESMYDLNTYTGRLSHFAKITDMR